MSTGQSLKPCVVITSKDRCEDLRTAIESCLLQTVKPEILVIDDGSSDSTAEMVRTEFPSVQLVVHEQSKGLVASRNEAAKLVDEDIVFSIDDDAVFTTPYVVEQTLKDFEGAEGGRVGAVAIPFVDVKKSPEVRQKAPSREECWITDRFIGTAHALRKDVFLKLEGYRESYFHQGEERDYCVRLLDAGYVVRMGNADLIHHFESPKRDTTRMDLYGRRNDIFFTWLNVPMPIFLIQLVGTSVKGILFGCRVKRPLRMLKGLFMGYGAIGTFWKNREPVKSETYRWFRKMQKQGALRIQDLSKKLLMGHQGKTS